MNILLLNPPGRRIYLRDYYCSKISKADYILHPVDLYVLSGILRKKHKLFVIDAIVEGLSEKECFKRIMKLKLDAVIFLTGQVSYVEDFRFMDRVKKATGIKVVGTGDIFMENGEEILKKYSFIDAILLDFTTRDILDYFDGKKADNMIYENKKRVTRAKWGQFDIPVPRHELFRNDLYTSPFMRYPKLVTVLTDYGCPYKCDFCIMGTIGYKFRSVENVMEELRFVKSLGIREIYFDDQTFGANRKRTMELLKRMKGMAFSWSCLSRVDVMTNDFVKAMSEAGCHTVMLGVESGSQKILNKYNKGITKEKIKEGFRVCRKYGVRAMGTFLIGLPGENEKDVNETIDFAIELKCDYASFNTPVPRMNTNMRKEAINDKVIGKDLYPMDQSGDYGIIRSKDLSPKKIRKLKNKAIRKFYFRPSYFIQRISAIKTFYELQSNIKSGLSIWRKK